MNGNIHDVTDFSVIGFINYTCHSDFLIKSKHSFIKLNSFNPKKFIKNAMHN